MTFFLAGSQDPEAETLDLDVPDFGARVGASFRSTRIQRNQWDQAGRLANEITNELIEEVGGVEPDFGSRPGRVHSSKKEQIKRQAAFAKINEARTTDNSLFEGLPGSDAEFDALVDRRLKAEFEEQQSILTNAPEGSWGAETIGAISADVSDEYSLMTLPFGAPGRVGILTTMGIEAGLGATFEGIQSTEKVGPMAERLQIDGPNVGQDMLFAGLTGGVLGGAIAAAPRYLQYRQAKNNVTAAAPNGVDPLAAHSAVEDASEVLETGRAVPVQNPASIPNIPNAPDNWDAIRGGIFAGESHGDYDALYEFSNRDGGPFSNVKITNMTVNQAIAFSRPNGEYGQWSKAKLGYVATPMGAYQIVGTTLRAAKRGLGLTGNEVMTPELQEALGQWIYRAQGTGAWEGYKGPVAGYTPDSFQTSRPYTGSGQVRAGDDITIDVSYEVVDASSLKRASGDLQPRDRTRGTSDAWIADTAARLDPAQLMPASTADRGALVVGGDNVIESGNGRFGAIERAYQIHPDRADAYRNEITKLGLEIPEGVERPILIARRTSDLSPQARRDFVVAAQDSGVARMTPTEIAQTSARAMTASRLSTFDPTSGLSDVENSGFVKSILAALPRSERNAMFDAKGAVNAEGLRRLDGAFYARAWSAPDLVSRAVEQDDAGELKSLMNALQQSAPDWATMRAEIEAGQVGEAFDITDFATDAMRMIARAREAAGESGGVADILSSMIEDVDLLEGALSPLTVRLVKQFYPDGRVASATKVSDFLSGYAKEARKVGKTGDMLGGTPKDVLSRLDKRFADLPDDLGRPRGQVNVAPVEVIAADIQARAIEDIDLAAIRSEFEATETSRAFLSDEITLPDGTSATVSDLLDDLEQDRAAIDAVNHCYLGGVA